MLATRQHERYPVIGKPGHFLTPWGDEIFEPPDDLAEARRRVVALTGEPERPFVSRVRTIDGRLPTAEQIAAVECELQKAPARPLRDFQDRGGKIEVIAGRNARLHPLDYHERNSYACLGWFTADRNLICVAGEADAKTVLHELIHAWDRIPRCRFSDTAEWKNLCAYGPWEARCDTPAERFAEAGALHFHSAATRDLLSEPLQDFIERVCR